MNKISEKVKKQKLLEDLLNKTNIDDFPKTPNDKDDTDSTILPKTYEDFHEEFSTYFKTSISSLLPIENRLLELENTLKQYAQAFLRDENDAFILRKKQTKHDLLDEQLSQIEISNDNELNAILKRRKLLLEMSGETEKSRYTVENLIYNSFRNDIYNKWSENVDVLDILNKVTSTQDFRAGFLQPWNDIIRRESSQNLLIDAFWYIYLKYFIKSDEMEEECEAYFSRIADNYVKLLLSVEPWFRDKFFNIYPSYLSQAIYMAFFDTFPDSRMNLTDKFKEYISSIISEWISGTQATADAYKNWTIKVDSTMVANVQEHTVSSSNDIFQKIARLEEELELLGEEQNENMKSSRSARSSAKTTTKKDSLLFLDNVVDIENELFNLNTQSALVTHYLQKQHIQDTTPRSGRQVKRTQIRGWNTHR
ncbi:unnamed protein product [Didymodactylos carnosus]|uniref:Uncharacterized protein n=1 Tax=Didymodactylos carnosus TaxID=1234261 RepID=A0A814TDA1_9BILA|nr:unnamed protein product [Didymodactylos carnosus]CAF1159900.1 unnamed protein product [Didymodactylos carnosus]CAF3761529.1 unnamed protein product [Didymodactylos carnosus]CAF3923378.1 unnamed protein product [Didymodactylos carnosus]